VKIARFLMTPEFLRDLLCLPLGTTIIWAGMDPSGIELTIEHPDLKDVELQEAARPPLIRPLFQREDAVVLLVDWGQG
jgi:hypothetical protein